MYITKAANVAKENPYDMGSSGLPSDDGLIGPDESPYDTGEGQKRHGSHDEYEVAVAGTQNPGASPQCKKEDEYALPTPDALTWNHVPWFVYCDET